MGKVNFSRILILSDGKPGHYNQSIAFAKALGCDYELVKVGFSSRWAKAFSYLFDHVGIYSSRLFDVDLPANTGFDSVVSTGSETYYANKTLARQSRLSSVAIMLPKGYRFNFDLIIAQKHDTPPQRGNIHVLPVNLSCLEPQGFVRKSFGEQYISLIVGGDSRHGILDIDHLVENLKKIYEYFPSHKFWLTTSRRTSRELEVSLRKFSFDFSVYYSEQQINPVADFLKDSDYVFITADSTSMISEAVSFGTARVEILPINDGFFGRGKFLSLITDLEERGCLHRFDGTLGKASNKIDQVKIVQDIVYEDCPTST